MARLNGVALPATVLATAREQFEQFSQSAVRAVFAGKTREPASTFITA